MAEVRQKADKICPGAVVEITGGTGRRLVKRAATGPVEGHRFPVVWAGAEDEWLAAQAEDREPDTVPWPASDVRPIEK
jgi:hypothetical protein